MKKNIRKNQKGFSLVELIIVLAIMAVLVAVLAPVYLQYVEKAKRSQYIQEADVFYNAAKVSFIDYAAMKGDFSEVKFKIQGSGSNTKYGRVTNWSILNPTAASSKLYPSVFNECLNLDKNKTISSIPLSNTVPDSSGGTTKMSMNDELIFQVLYDTDGNIIVDYNRNGYFVRITASEVTCVKLKNENDSQFTKIK